ncbi:MAG TPA: hypothetical protein VFI23_12425 [Rhizomicrobium sp.]|nr:hypothetical protein [Rhizomicrobium sp.]
MVDSKAIAIMIVGLGIIVLIVSAAIGTPVDDSADGFSGSPTGASARAGSHAFLAFDEWFPPVERSPDFDDGRDMACTVAIKLATARATDRGFCVLAGYGAGEWRCTGKIVHNCIGDFSSTDDTPSDIEEAKTRATSRPGRPIKG